MSVTGTIYDPTNPDTYSQEENDYIPRTATGRNYITPFFAPQGMLPASAPAYPTAGASVPAGATPASPTEAPPATEIQPLPQISGPATAQPNVPIDPLREKVNQLDLLTRLGPMKPKIGWKERIAAMIAGGTAGWGDARRGGNAAAGIQAAENILAMPRERAAERYRQQVQGLQLGISSEERMRQQQMEAEKQQADTAYRQRETQHMDWIEGGGAERAKMTAEQKFRDSQVPNLRKAGYSDSEIAEFQATGKTRDNMPKSDMEALIMAHEVGPDGQPTPRAQQAAAAHKQYIEDRLREIRATKDPNETVRMVGLYLNDLMAQRGQIDNEMKEMQKNTMLMMTDPQAKSRVQLLQGTLNSLDQDISAAREYVSGRVPGMTKKTTGGGGTPQQKGQHWDPKAGRYVSDTPTAPPQ